MIEDDYFFLAGIALSRLGIVPTQFAELTPREFQAAIDDHDAIHANSVKSIIKSNRIDTWEAARWQIFWKNNLAAMKGRPKKLTRIEQVVKFPWEVSKQPVQQSTDEMKRILFALAGKRYET